jgi:hypothetical protein
MPTRLHLTHQPDFSGTLPFAFAPDGELTFADGVTTVPDDDPLDWLSRYPGLDVVDDADAPAPDSPNSDDAETWDESDAPFDPRALTVSELRDAVADADPTPAERTALAALEREGDGRSTALEAIGAPGGK